jgi:hypothetical protein
MAVDLGKPFYWRWPTDREWRKSTAQEVSPGLVQIYFREDGITMKGPIVLLYEIEIRQEG